MTKIFRVKSEAKKNDAFFCNKIHVISSSSTTTSSPTITTSFPTATFSTSFQNHSFNTVSSFAKLVGQPNVYQNNFPSNVQLLQIKYLPTDDFNTEINQSFGNELSHFSNGFLISDPETLSELELPIKNKSWLRSLKGFICAVFAGFCFASSSFLIKELIDYSISMVAVYRFITFAMLTTPMVYSSGKEIFGPKNLRIFLCIRGVTVATNLYFRYIAFQLLYIADATVIILSMPIFVFIFSRIFLKEPFTRFHFITLMITLLGVVITCKVNLFFGLGDERVNNINPYGVAAAFLATIVGAAMFIVARKLKSLHPSVILNNMAWIALTQSLIINSIFGEFKLPSSGYSSWYIISLGIISFYAQFFLTIAIKNEEAGFVSMIRGSSQVTFAFLFQTFVLKHVPDIYSIVGAILVSFALLLIGLRRAIIILPKEHFLREKLSFLFK